ncbi:hypothetical protein [Methylobacterium sp.]|uniref:HNH endonuclease n=1 Tax=Methylobacterium sp. TaxID=409 RepID=UPI0015CD8F01|nr:hypothetical protein [Methylobacterium sp.]
MIANPVAYNSDQIRQINATLSDTELSASKWTDDKLDDIKAHIKQHYINEQKYRCCYCQQALLAHHGRVWDVEHIIPRSEKPKFMFHPKNLAVACVECNGSKSSIQVTDKDYVRFTEDGSKYKIVHPHLDQFEDHIEIEGEYTYHALSKKGSFTIYHCDLFRFRQRESAIRRPIRDRRFERDIGELRYARTRNEAAPIIASIMAQIEIVEEGK